MKNRSATSQTWQDHYTRQAQKEHYPARSVYKLQEIQKKFNLMHKGQKVLDLGCAPGAWLLYAGEVTGPGGTVMGIDLKPVTVKLPRHVRAVVGNILDRAPPVLREMEGGFHVVLSDMAPATTGAKDVDAARSYELCLAALDIARQHLTPGGAFVCKIFQGEDFKIFTDAVRAEFRHQKIFKPQSSRKASKEIYIIGIGKK
ncbi:MAG: RlmE family RNA methyltransferase [Desulfobacterales bacterium]|jgi:23S rRNA (uridine2552-2'-O)-methyltransferase|nr:RlmE family RNA methyltransferase [Desulfobacterales bacterium]